MTTSPEGPRALGAFSNLVGLREHLQWQSINGRSWTPVEVEAFISQRSPSRNLTTEAMSVAPLGVLLRSGARRRLIHTQKPPLGGLGAIHTFDPDLPFAAYLTCATAVGHHKRAFACVCLRGFNLAVTHHWSKGNADQQSFR